MILGLSVHTFTVIHVLISLVGIVAGVIVAFAMVQGKSVPGWTALALLALILTSVTGFFFHNTDLHAGAGRRHHIAGGAGGRRHRPLFPAPDRHLAVDLRHRRHDRDLSQCLRRRHPVLPENRLSARAGADAKHRAGLRRLPGRRCWRSSSCSVSARCESSIRTPHNFERRRNALAGRSIRGDDRTVIHEA